MNRQNNFNALRLMAAIMVMVGHMAYLTGGLPATILGAGVQAIGVQIFFLIGGYLITKSYLSDPHPIRYLCKRVLRIFPPLIVFVLLAVFVAGPLLSSLPADVYFRQYSTWNYLRNLLLFPIYYLPGVFQENIYPGAVNGSLWTLPVEFFMYLILPLLLNITGIRQNRRYAKPLWIALTMFVFAANLYRIAYYPNFRLVIYGTDWMQAMSIIPFYFIGSMFATCIPKEKLNLQIAALLLLGSMIFRTNNLTEVILLSIALSYFVFSFAFAPMPAFAKLMQKQEITYGLYLYGFFIQQLLVDVIANRMHISIGCNLYILLSVPLTAGFAYLSAVFVETPANKLCKKLTQKIR